MRRLNQMSNLWRIFDCFSGRFGKVVFNLKLPNSTDSDVASHVQFILELNWALVKFAVWEIGATEVKNSGIKLWIEFNLKV